MNSNTFVKQKIDELVIQFPSIKCSYEFDESDYTHSVEVLPTDFFKLSEEFSVAENNIYNEFFELFPSEGLYFITNDAFVPVSNPIYSKQGHGYILCAKFNNAEPSKVSLLNDSINYVVSSQHGFNVNSVNAISVFSTDYKNSDGIISPLIDTFSNNVLIANSGEIKYALAA